jgi:hypothetical protein
MTSKFVEIVPLAYRQGNGIFFAAIRRPVFGDWLSFKRTTNSKNDCSAGQSFHNASKAYSLTVEAVMPCRQRNKHHRPNQIGDWNCQN